MPTGSGAVPCATTHGRHTHHFAAVTAEPPTHEQYLERLNSCPCRLAKAISSPAVRNIAGSLMLYGLFTWYLGGAGLLIAAIGLGIWLVSALLSASLHAYDAHINNQNLEEFNDYPDKNYSLEADEQISPLDVKRLKVEPSKAFFSDLVESVGWATPAGTVVWTLWVLFDVASWFKDTCAKFYTGHEVD